MIDLKSLFAGWTVVMATAALGAPQLSVKEHIIDPKVQGGSSAVDVDRDGRMDLIAGGWWQNQGDDRWTRRELPGRCIGDLDGDGYPDCIGLSPLGDPGSGHRFVWYKNPGGSGNPTQREAWKKQAETTVALTEIKQYGQQDTFAADFDLDGHPDVAVFGWKLRVGNDSWKDQGKINNGWLAFIYRNADGTLFSRVVDPSPASHEGAAMGDLDSDGDADLVFNGVWLENPGNRSGEWAKHIIDAKWHSQIAAGDNFRPNAVQVGLGDLDSDGKLDVVLCQAESDQRWPVSWYSASDPRRGPWTEHVIAYHTTCHTLHVADFDGDGRRDVFAHKFWYRNPGGDLTAPWVRRDFGYALLDVFASADVDGDQFVDVLAQGDIGKDEVEICWLEAEDRAATSWRTTVIGRVSKTFHGWHQWFGVAQIVPGGPPEVFVGEAKIDGTTHLVWWENDGGAVAQWPRHDVGGGISGVGENDKSDADRIVLADLNGDGRHDILVGNEQHWTITTEISPVYWYEAPKNQRTPNWRRTTLATVLGAQSLSAADLDLDGDVDIVLNENRGAKGSGRKREMILENHGGGVFSAPVAIDRGVSAHNAAYLADLDGDGDLDVINASYFQPDVKYVWMQRNDAVVAAAPRAPEVRIEPAEFEERAQLRVTTPAATCWLDTAAGGFSKLTDRDGRDWIAFSKTPLSEVPASAAAGFRGLPNLGFENGAGHPGFDSCESTVAGPATIRARTKNGRVEWTWTFSEETVRFRMDRNESAQPWWFLYEGPIAGQWSPQTHYWATDRSGGVRREIFSAKDQMLAPIQWIYFGDDRSPRVLFLAHLRPDDVVDNLWWLPSTKGDLVTAANGMTVFGFGRDRNTKPMLRGAGQEFLVGFLEDQAADAAAHQRIAAAIERRITYALRETSAEKNS